MDEPKFSGITIDLDEIDGNIFMIGGRVAAALRRWYHQPADVIDMFYTELHAATSYAAAIDVVRKWVTVEGEVAE